MKTRYLGNQERVNMKSPFDTLTIGTLELKNRFVRSATYDYYGNSDGTISEEELEIIRDLASNEVGTIITALMSVSPFGLAEKEQNRIDDDKFIVGLSKVCDIAHQYGSKLIVQLCHAGGIARPEENENHLPVGPSSITMPNEILTRELSNGEINAIIDDFTMGAKRSFLAGADGVQIHGAHGYLLSQFVSFIENNRHDIYGGTVENRFRFIREIKERISESVSCDFPVWLKINSNIKGDNDRYLKELVEMIHLAKDCGISLVEMSGTGFSTLKGNPAPYFLDQVITVKKNVDIPIAIVGGIRTMDEIKDALDSGIELISMSRPFISQPDLIRLFEKNVNHAQCIHCQKCFELPKTHHKRCVFYENPE